MMARTVLIVAALLFVCSAVYAQQLVSCTFTSAGRQNNPSTFSRAGVTRCWQLDGLAGALETGEVAAPASATLVVNNDASSALPVDTCAASGCDKSSIACATDAAAIYGKIRELRVKGQILNNDQSAITVRASGGKLGYSSDTTNSVGTLIYRLDGTGSCSASAGSPGPYSQDFTLSSVSGRTLSSMGDAFEITVGSDLATTVTIDVYGSSASVKTTFTIQVAGGTSDPASAVNYIIPFSSFSGSADAFSNTGAIEVSFGGENRDTAVYFFDVVPLASTSVSARVFQDCGCNGFTSDDTPQSNVVVTLTVSGSGSCTGSTTQTTPASGSVTFGSLPAGCTYTLSTSGLSLCSNSQPSQTVSALGNADFAILGTTGQLSIPPTATVNCGGDTSTAATGVATVTGGSCGSTSSGPATFVDTVSTATCTAPGGTIQTISRAWTGAGSTQTQIINVRDAGSITFTNVPASVTISCTDSLPTSTATATACTAVTVTSADSTAVSTCDTTSCTATQLITRTFTATDQCGSTQTRTQTITRNGCAPNCPTPPPAVPPPPTSAPPPPTNLPTNANCRFICDDDDSSAAALFVSALLAAILAVAAAF